MNRKMIFLNLFVILIIFSCNTNYEKFEKSIFSPDKSLELKLFFNNNKLHYEVVKDNKIIIEKSLLGIEGEIADYKTGSDFIVNNISYNNKYEKWDQVWGEQKTITNHYNEIIISGKFNYDYGADYKIKFRNFNDGIGFRYELESPKNSPTADNIPTTIYKNKKDIAVVRNELTQFNFTEDSNSWWIPAYAYRRYEFLYANTKISEISRQNFSDLVEYLNPDDRIGPEAVQTPFTIQRDDGITIAIHEANLTNYSSMALKVNGTKLECDLFPWSDGVKVRRQEEKIISPWRTIIVANSPAELTMSTLTLNLNEPNKLADTNWIKPGKYIGLWWEMIGTNQSTWGSGPNHGAKTNRVLEYLDFGSKYNFDGVLVEGWNTGWDDNWCCSGDGGKFDFYNTHPDFDNKIVAEYAEKKGIRLVGHHETGSQIENYESQLDSAFAYCNRNGIRVVKTGYVNDGVQNIKRKDENGEIQKEWHHGQYMVEHCRKVLETAAKYNVSLVVHEPIKDTGIRRTFPNMLSREGARGQEFNGFMPKDWNNKPNHTTIIPFTRLLSSPMDYTPGIFNLTDYRYNSPEDRTINKSHHIPSTIAKELALYVVIYAPMQMAADLPQNYEGHPAFKFILDVPTDWENTITLNGEIGEYITVARKDINSNDWYIGSITNEKEREVNIDLSFLDSNTLYKATIYKDPIGGGWEQKPEEIIIDEITLSSEDNYKFSLPKGGGHAIKLTPNP